MTQGGVAGSSQHRVRPRNRGARRCPAQGARVRQRTSPVQRGRNHLLRYCRSRPSCKERAARLPPPLREAALTGETPPRRAPLRRLGWTTLRAPAPQEPRLAVVMWGAGSSNRWSAGPRRPRPRPRPGPASRSSRRFGHPASAAPRPWTGGRLASHAANARQKAATCPRRPGSS